MIDAELADKFIKRAAQYTKYNINVMNEKGIIIASSNSARIGTFHEIAYLIMSGEEENIEVYPNDNFQGGRTGINMALMYKGNKTGVVGISGDPDVIRDIAHIVKMSLEVMIDYEMKKQQHYQRQNLRTRFLDGLLYDEEADREGELSAFSEQLGYDPLRMRLPILMVPNSAPEMDRVLEKIRQAGVFGRQDIFTITRNNNLMIFKCFVHENEIFQEYRELLSETIERIDHCLKEIMVECTYYVGSFQRQYRYYRQGFLHSRWLWKELALRSQHVNYFYDYVGDYMRETVSLYELSRIFSPLCDNLDPDTKNSMVEMISTLDRNNYSLKESSEKLFIHKNTLIFRYNKIKNMFRVNPIQNTADREFMNWMNLYLRKNR